MYKCTVLIVAPFNDIKQFIYHYFSKILFVLYIYIVIVIAKHCIFCTVYKIGFECSPVALEFDCSKGYWVHGSAGGI